MKYNCKAIPATTTTERTRLIQMNALRIAATIGDRARKRKSARRFRTRSLLIHLGQLTQGGPRLRLLS